MRTGLYLFRFDGSIQRLPGCIRTVLGRELFRAHIIELCEGEEIDKGDEIL